MAAVVQLIIQVANIASNTIATIETITVTWKKGNKIYEEQVKPVVKMFQAANKLAEFISNRGNQLGEGSSRSLTDTEELHLIKKASEKNLVELKLLGENYSTEENHEVRKQIEERISELLQKEEKSALKLEELKTRFLEEKLE